MKHTSFTALTELCPTFGLSKLRKRISVNELCIRLLKMVIPNHCTLTEMQGSYTQLKSLLEVTINQT